MLELPIGASDQFSSAESSGERGAFCAFAHLSSFAKQQYQIPSSSFTIARLARSLSDSSETSLPFLMTKTR